MSFVCIKIAPVEINFTFISLCVNVLSGQECHRLNSCFSKLPFKIMQLTFILQPLTIVKYFAFNFPLFCEFFYRCQMILKHTTILTVPSIKNKHINSNDVMCWCGPIQG